MPENSKFKHEGHEIVVEVKTWIAYPVTSTDRESEDELLVLDVDWSDGDSTGSSDWEDRIYCNTCHERLYAEDFAEHKTMWEAQ